MGLGCEGLLPAGPALEGLVAHLQLHRILVIQEQRPAFAARAGRHQAEEAGPPQAVDGPEWQPKMAASTLST
jgi:hypothetical protein